MIEPCLAIVTPRVVSEETGETLPLDGGFLDLHRIDRGSIEIAGGVGSGKTSALAHLAECLPAWGNVVLLDEPPPGRVAVEAVHRLVVYTTAAPRTPPADARYRLAPWTADDRIEYLLATHRAECASVVERLRRAGEDSMLDGTPALWRLALDRMAERPETPGPAAALLDGFRAVVRDQAWWESVGEHCLGLLMTPSLQTPEFVHALPAEIDAPLARALRHPAVWTILAVEHVAESLERGRPCPWLDQQLPKGLVARSGKRIAASPASLNRLRNHNSVMALSLLHAAGCDCRPDSQLRIDLRGAYLDEVYWPDVVLPAVQLSDADLSRAILTGASLGAAVAHRTSFRGSVLRAAQLAELQAMQADFHAANLIQVNAPGAKFFEADLSDANLSSAVLEGASLSGADLTNAILHGAKLARVNLLKATLDGTDFTQADLTEAIFDGVRLTHAKFDGAAFLRASLRRADMQYMRLPKADFRDACLANALLTGSSMPEANFMGADLQGAVLADIDWPEADLSGADLRCCEFHLGSSRSGMVGCPYLPMEGSRTGFYTDDSEEQHFKPPEEIRKANLRGADLRGAKLEGTDFYLVDLRDAQYTPKQAELLRRSGAIL